MALGLFMSHEQRKPLKRVHGLCDIHKHSTNSQFSDKLGLCCDILQSVHFFLMNTMPVPKGLNIEGR